MPGTCVGIAPTSPAKEAKMLDPAAQLDPTDERDPYAAPTLTPLGTLAELTQGELTGAFSDGAFSTDDQPGSISPS
jgi:hypothetical protein